MSGKFWNGQIWEKIVKFPLTFGNNLKKKGFENVEEISTYSEILEKFQKNFEIEDSDEILFIFWKPFEKIRSQKFWGNLKETYGKF